MESKHTEAAPDRRAEHRSPVHPDPFYIGGGPEAPALRSGAASVCLLFMTFLLGASRLGLFISEMYARIEPFGGIGIPFLLGAPM